ncbi:MAG TPA: VOC family protein [Chloroflexota bacterium]|nr:VOC family protein [Chloroflexota bacterium]
MDKARITGIHTVGIPVADQERALRFYVEELGFETRLDRPTGNGQRWIEVAPRGAQVTLALMAATHEAPAGVETGIRLITEDADAMHGHLRSHAVEAGEVLRWPGVPPMFAFRDPDGNGLEIIERAPVAAR